MESKRIRTARANMKICDETAAAALKTLKEIMEDAETPKSVRLQAGQAILAAQKSMRDEVRKVEAEEYNKRFFVEDESEDE